MPRRSRILFATSVSVEIFLLLLLLCTPILAQEAGKARQAVSREAIQAILGTTWLGLLVIVIFGIGIGGLAIQLWTRATFPRRSAAVLRALEGQRWKLFLVGLVNLTFLTLLFLFFCSRRWLGLLGVLLGMVMLALVFLGLLAKSERLGAKILTAAGRNPNPIANIVVGWPVLYFVAIIPFLGWALLLYLIISGTGAAVLSFLGNAKSSAAEAEETP